MTIIRIRYLSICILLFSGTLLFISCENNPRWVQIVGGGGASAKFGDSTIAFRDTLVSNNISYAADGNNSFSSVKNINLYSINSTQFQIGISISINPGWVGTYSLNYINYASVSGILSANNNGSFYTTDSTHTGEFTITSYNQQLEIISGTFRFTAVLDSVAHIDSVGHILKSDTVVVSEGNFVANLKYDIQQQ